MTTLAELVASEVEEGTLVRAFGVLLEQRKASGLWTRRSSSRVRTQIEVPMQLLRGRCPEFSLPGDDVRSRVEIRLTGQRTRTETNSILATLLDLTEASDGLSTRPHDTPIEHDSTLYRLYIKKLAELSARHTAGKLFLKVDRLRLNATLDHPMKPVFSLVIDIYLQLDRVRTDRGLFRRSREIFSAFVPVVAVIHSSDVTVPSKEGGATPTAPFVLLTSAIDDLRIDSSSLVDFPTYVEVSEPLIPIDTVVLYAVNRKFVGLLNSSDSSARERAQWSLKGMSGGSISPDKLFRSPVVSAHNLGMRELGDFSPHPLSPALHEHRGSESHLAFSTHLLALLVPGFSDLYSGPEGVQPTVEDIVDMTGKFPVARESLTTTAYVSPYTIVTLTDMQWSTDAPSPSRNPPGNVHTNPVRHRSWGNPHIESGAGWDILISCLIATQLLVFKTYLELQEREARPWYKTVAGFKWMHLRSVLSDFQGFQQVGLLSPSGGAYFSHVHELLQEACGLNRTYSVLRDREGFASAEIASRNAAGQIITLAVGAAAVVVAILIAVIR